MLNRPERRRITQSPGTDRRKLSLNSFVAYGRVEILGAFLQGRKKSSAAAWPFPVCVKKGNCFGCLLVAPALLNAYCRTAPTFAVLSSARAGPPFK